MKKKSLEKFNDMNIQSGRKKERREKHTARTVKLDAEAFLIKTRRRGRKPGGECNLTLSGRKSDSSAGWLARRPLRMHQYEGASSRLRGSDWSPSQLIPASS
jgi:hypothetical protein